MSEHFPPQPGRINYGAIVAAVVLLAGVMLWVRQSWRPVGVDAVVRAPWATTAERAAQRRETMEKTINANLNLPLNLQSDARWQQFLGAVKWQADRRPEVLAAMRLRLQMPILPPRSSRTAVETQRLALETAFGLFPLELEPEMRRIWMLDHEPKRVAMAGHWLVRKNGNPDHRTALENALTSRFPDWAGEPRFLALVSELRQPRAVAIRSRPPLTDLLQAPFDGRPVIFSLQRTDRQFEGRAVVRHANGQFILDASGDAFSVGQFALSASGLPGTLTNGNTPSGIFEVTETSTSRNLSIGPSELLVLGLPLEYDRTWTESRYQNLLPESWRVWWPIREAWWAGRAGRNEILAHGTTVDPAPWRDTVFAGLTPSHGCLTCQEMWDPATGQRLSSEQARLVRGWRQAGGGQGYLVVVEIDDQPRPISVGESDQIVKGLR